MFVISSYYRMKTGEIFVVYYFISTNIVFYCVVIFMKIKGMEEKNETVHDELFLRILVYSYFCIVLSFVALYYRFCYKLLFQTFRLPEGNSTFHSIFFSSSSIRRSHITIINIFFLLHDCQDVYLSSQLFEYISSLPRI